MHEQLKNSRVVFRLRNGLVLLFASVYFLVGVPIHKRFIRDKSIGHLQRFELLNSIQEHFDLPHLVFLFGLTFVAFFRLMGVALFLSNDLLHILMTPIQISIFRCLIRALYLMEAKILPF